MLTPNERIPEYIRSLVPYVPGKPIEETQREYGLKTVIKLASNENPLGPSPAAVAAVRAALKDLHRYPDGSGFRLKAALAKHLGVSATQLILGNGSNELIDFLVRAYCLPGDAIVTSHAAFIAYRLCAQIHGVRSLETPLTPDLKFDLPALLERVRADERANLVFIANPNNPTGTYVDEESLRDFLTEVIQIRGGKVLVALDYAYWEYVMARDLPDPMKLLAEFPNVVVLRTFSKVYGLAGLRIGYGVAHPELVSSLEKVRQPFNLNSLALAGAEAALGDRAFVRKAKAENARGMKDWTRALGKLKIPFWPSQGNFILIDTQRGLGKTGPEVYQACLKKGVIFRPVANYGLPGALRISIGTAAENKRAIAALATL